MTSQKVNSNSSDPIEIPLSRLSCSINIPKLKVQPMFCEAEPNSLKFNAEEEYDEFFSDTDEINKTTRSSSTDTNSYQDKSLLLNFGTRESVSSENDSNNIVNLRSDMADAECGDYFSNEELESYVSKNPPKSSMKSNSHRSFRFNPSSYSVSSDRKNFSISFIMRKYVRNSFNGSDSSRKSIVRFNDSDDIKDCFSSKEKHFEKKNKKLDIRKIWDDSSKNRDCLDISGNGLAQCPVFPREAVGISSLMICSNELVEIHKSIGDLRNLKTLLAQCNMLHAKSFPLEMATCTQLKMIDLRNNRIESMPIDLFENFQDLEVLLLNNNKLTELDSRINKFMNLKVLRLRENSISDSIPGSIGQLKNLHSLDLSGNNIKNLPPEIGDCENLRELCLHHNHLFKLPDEIGNLKNLKNLSLKYNQLTTLPYALVNCTNLVELNLESNKINSLPSNLLAGLLKISRVHLGRNCFDNFPVDDPLQLSCVKSLKLNHNKIKTIPYQVFSLAENMSHLNLSMNEISELDPLDLTNNWHRFDEIDLSSNSLVTLPPEIEKLKNLTKFHLACNLLQELPDKFFNLTKLTILDLESNELCSLPNAIQLLVNLENLNISDNKLKSLPAGISKLENLKVLRVSENDLLSLPPEIGQLKSLNALFLNDNENLSCLPVELGKCESLRFLNLKNCRLNEIPAQIVKEGPAIIISFLKQVLIYQENREAASKANENLFE